MEILLYISIAQSARVAYTITPKCPECNILCSRACPFSTACFSMIPFLVFKKVGAPKMTYSSYNKREMLLWFKLSK